MLRMRFRSLAFILALGLLISATQASTAVGQAAAQGPEPVAVRFGQHPGFSRIVFDWRRPVGARLEQVGGKALLHFDRAATLDLKAFRANPPREVSNIEAAAVDGGLVVTVTISPGAKTRLFENAGKTVLDVFRLETPAGAQASTPGDSHATGTKAIGKKAQANPGAAEQLAIESKPAASPVAPDSPLPVISEPISLLPPAFDRASAAPKSSPAPTDQADAGTTKNAAVDPPSTRKRPPRPPVKPLAKNLVRPLPKPAAPPAAAGQAAAPDERQASAAPPKTVAGVRSGAPMAPSASVPRVPAGTVPVLIDTSPLPGKTLSLGQRRVLRFEWPAGAAPAAAAFRRDGNLWLVFDRPPPRDLAGETAKAAPELAPVTQFEVDGATVLRFSVSGLMTPRLRREDSTWIVNLDRGAPESGTAIEMRVGGAPGQTRVSFPLETPGRIVSFVDPERGDRLIVVPLSTAGLGTPRDREFPQFRNLASYQGLVVQPLSETLRVTPAPGSPGSPGAVELHDDEGLIVSRGGSLALLKSNQPAPRRGTRLFDLASWRRGEADRFAVNKHELLSAIAAADPIRGVAVRLELAEFFFAHGLSTEALSLIRLSQARDRRLVLDPRAQLIAGAAEFLAGDYTTAAKELFHPALAGEWEADLWRAALAAASQDWDLAAAGFSVTEELIDTYPQVVRARLRLLAAEANLAIGNQVVAESYLEAVRRDNPSRGMEAQVTYLVGRGLYIEGDTETAAELWRRVAGGKHASSRIRARLALLDLALEDGSISTGKAIEELERLRFAWRGDRFEFALLQRLGDLYILNGSHRQGLRLLRRAATHTPNPELSAAVAARMRAVFAGQFQKANSDLPPLQALTLFEEFKELTPPGEVGDAIILNLAERLVEIDLLDRAASVLQTQVEFRLKGTPRARVAARLAQILLMGQNPGRALQALDASELSDLPAELSMERRRLRAQALLGLEREEEALAALGPAGDPESLRLRARILSRQKAWPATVLALERLVPKVPPEARPLREGESKAVVDLLVALTMADQRDRIRNLGRTYREAMSRGPHAETFRLLVGDSGSSDDKTAGGELSGAADFEAFMASYRKNNRTLGNGETR